MKEIVISLNDDKYKQVLAYAKFNNLTPETLCEEYINNTLEEIEETINFLEEKGDF